MLGAVNLSVNATPKERVTKQDLDIRNDIAYLPNENIPFTGRYETYYPNGNKMGVAHIKDGKFDGLMTLWDESGLNKSDKYIKNGIDISAKQYSEMTISEKNKIKSDLNTMLNTATPDQIKRLAEIVIPNR
jgi:antitoxin component YwqK of YwqJK toxin-antitoxin module